MGGGGGRARLGQPWLGLRRGRSTTPRGQQRVSGEAPHEGGDSPPLHPLQPLQPLQAPREGGDTRLRGREEKVDANKGRDATSA